MPSDRRANAEARGAQLVDRVRQLGPDRFLVPSQSGEGMNYVVKRETPIEGFPVYRCTCTAAGQGYVCAHAEAARLYHERPVEKTDRTPTDYGPRKTEKLT